MKTFLWTYVASIGDSVFYRYIRHHESFKEATWYYTKLSFAAAFILALYAALTLPSVLQSATSSAEQALSKNAPSEYHISVSEAGVANTTLPQPFVVSFESFAHSAPQDSDTRNAFVFDTAASTTELATDSSEDALDMHDTFVLLTQDTLYVKPPTNAEAGVQKQTMDAFAGMAVTQDDVSAILAFPHQHPYLTALISFIFAGAASLIATTLLYFGLLIAAMLTFGGIYITYPNAATYTTSANATLHAATLPLTGAVILHLFSLPQITLGLFLMFSVFFGLLNLHRALYEEQVESSNDAEK